MEITITYCTSWGYFRRAVDLRTSIKSLHKENVSIKLVPSTGGVFEVSLNGKVIFSKLKLDRYPNVNEVEDIIADFK